MLLSRRLSPGEDALVGAQFLEGLLALNRAVLLRKATIVGWLNDYLQAVPAERFRGVLPVLRRAMADLNAVEQDYLLASLARLLGLEDGAAAPAARLAISDQELQAIDEELDDLLNDL